jgi:hypothetical protein
MEDFQGNKSKLEQDPAIEQGFIALREFSRMNFKKLYRSPPTDELK